MPASTTFTGIGLSLQSVTPGTGATSLAVRFTNDPLQVTPAGTHDGLNPVNYSLTGPGIVSIVSVGTNGTDAQTLTVNLSTPLSAGIWTLTVVNIQTPTGSSLVPPTSLGFLVNTTANVTELTAGAYNDDASAIIRKHLSQAMQGPNWDALIAALSIGDDINWSNAELAFDQLFVSSASGKYLDRLAANQGLTRPENVGMSDDLFRQLVIALNADKLTHEALREVLEIFYGQDALRAFAETTLEEPFNIQDGSNLTWTVDETQTFNRTFSSSDFALITGAKATELAAILTKAMGDAGSFGFAAAVTNSTTGNKRVRIYSGSLGLKSFVRITGGTAQNKIRFPLYKEVYTGTVTSGNAYGWAYSKPSQNVTRLTLTTVGQPLIDLSSVQAGDYLVLGPLVGLPQGSYSILSVGYSWSGGNLTQTFDLNVDLGFVGTITQQSNDDYRFFTPQKESILNGTRTVVVAQTIPGQIDIQIPATTQAVNRTARTAAYGRDNAALPVKRYLRDGNGIVTIELQTALATPLNTNSRIYLEGFQPAISRPWVSPGVRGTSPSVATADASYGICLSNVQQPPSTATNLAKLIQLQTGDVLMTGGVHVAAGVSTGEQKKANRFHLVSGTTPIVDVSEANGVGRFSYQWIATADLNTARLDHAQSMLHDGRVLATGGMTSGNTIVFNHLTVKNNPELYSPSLNTWVNQNAMVLGRTGHQQVTLSNGKIIVIGGAWNMGTASNTAELFDPASMTWTAAPSMVGPRYQHKAVTLQDGRVMVTGGRTLGQVLNKDESFIHWSMDDTANPTNVGDDTGNYPLPVNGSPTIINGKVNTARDFTAGTTWASEGALVNDAQAITACTGEWTFEFWIPAGSMTDGVIMAYGGPTPNVLANNVLMEIGLTGGKIFWKWQNGAGVNVTQTATASIAGYTSYGVFIAVRKQFNGATYDVSWFLNGQKMDTWTGNANAAGGTNAQWYICADPKASPVQSGGARGILDEMRMTKTARSDFLILYDYYITSGWAWSLWDLPHAQGVCLDTTEFYDPVGNTWTTGPRMVFGRAMHQMFLLPDGRVLVFGGVGRDVSSTFPQQLNFAPNMWPNNELLTAEIYDPATNRWYPANAPSQGYVDSAAMYVSTTNQIIVTSDQNKQAIDYVNSLTIPTDETRIEAFDCATRTWKMLPISINLNTFSFFDYGIHVGSGVCLIDGGFDASLNGLASPILIIPGSQQFSGGGLNGGHRVVSSTTSLITIQTPSFAFFTTNFGDSGHNGKQIYDTTNSSFDTILTNYTNVITNAARTTNVTTLTLSSTSNLSVGQSVYVDIANVSYPNGVKVLTAVTTTTVSYADIGANVGSAGTSGIVAINQNTGAAIRLGAVPARPTNDPGPYIFDPDNGLAIVGVEVTLQSAIKTGQQVPQITLSSNTGFSTGGGYLVFGFGGPIQSKPIKYLGKIGTTILLFDYTYVAEFDFPIGTTVTLLAGRGPFVPDEPLKSANFYVTGSTAGRIAAQAFTTQAAAAGIALNYDVVFPGDRGLGAEGFPTKGSGKLSDAVEVWGSDNLDGGN